VKAVALIALATAGSLAIIVAGIALRSGPDTPSPDTVVEAGSPGALVLVDDGSSRREETSGLAVLEGRIPLRAHDRFRIGSITKTFVAVVVLQLVDEHRLGLTDTVERWLPGLVHANARSTATTGAMAFAHHPGSTCQGSTMAIIAPSGAPSKTAGLQGKSRRVPGVRALWGQQWTRLASRFLPYARSTAPTGAWPSPTD